MLLFTQVSQGLSDKEELSSMDTYKALVPRKLSVAASAAVDAEQNNESEEVVRRLAEDCSYWMAKLKQIEPQACLSEGGKASRPVWAVRFVKQRAAPSKRCDKVRLLLVDVFLRLTEKPVANAMLLLLFLLLLTELESADKEGDQDADDAAENVLQRAQLERFNKASLKAVESRECDSE